MAHTWVKGQCAAATALSPPEKLSSKMATGPQEACRSFKKSSGYEIVDVKPVVWDHPSTHWQALLQGMIMVLASASILTYLSFLVTALLFAKDVSGSQPFDIQESWAQYSPYFPAAPYVTAPNRCKVVQANIIQRHGSRYPTKGATERIITTLTKLQSVSTNLTDPQLLFLKNYTYSLGNDDLVASGARESQESAVQHFLRYGHLISKKKLPFVRASGSERVILSATNWTQGFSIASHGQYNAALSVILSEELNDTLADAMCPNAGNSDQQTNQWLLQYGTPLAEHLNSKAPGANLTPTDVYNLISLCPFETAAMGSSPWCNVFQQADFEAFEYSGDLDKYYNTGYGQDLGPVQGVGYINELLARLTGNPVVDHTQTNQTLDSSLETFPLDRPLYVDFSHDNQMIAIYAAMGLFKQAKPLDPTMPDPERTWWASRMVTFAARMATEKLVCGGKPYVRVFVNDALQPSEFCGGMVGVGLCELERFVESQAYARNDGDGDFERCFN